MFGLFRSIIGWALAVSIVLAGVVPVGAQDEQPSEPVVYGVLFYSSSCPHCHAVIENYVPQWEEEFGASFILLYINVGYPAAAELFYVTCAALNAEHCGSVPFMVIGETVMIGSIEIPARVPGLIRDGLAQGGIDLPPVPELRAAYAAYLASQEVTPEATPAPEATVDPEGTPPPAEATSEAEITPEETAAVVEATVEPEASPEVQETAVTHTGPTDDGGTGALGGLTAAPNLAPESESWLAKLDNDPEGNAIAIVTLWALIISLVLQLQFGPRGLLVEGAWLSAVFIWIIIIASTAMAITLVGESSDDTLATLTSWGTLALLAVCVILLSVARINAYSLTPLVAVAGLLAAVYLAQIEVSDSDPTCGLIGDCGTVQQSQYAELFGILPIGVLGVMGYVAMLVVWFGLRFLDRDSSWTCYGQLALLGMALFGVAFSVYLTFLEPFVIGATCIWCITSALVMMLLLWLVAPSGWAALRQLRRTEKPAEVTSPAP